MLPFTVEVHDPSGNSFIQNPHAPNSDPYMKKRHFLRTKKMLVEMGFVADTEEEKDIEGDLNYRTEYTKEEMDDIERRIKLADQGISNQQITAYKKDESLLTGHDFTQPLDENIMKKEAVEFITKCFACEEMGMTRVCVNSIPNFKEIVIYAFTCDECGYKNVDVKGGGSISAKGKRIELIVRGEIDLHRDLFKVYIYIYIIL